MDHVLGRLNLPATACTVNIEAVTCNLLCSTAGRAGGYVTFARTALWSGNIAGTVHGAPVQVFPFHRY